MVIRIRKYSLIFILLFAIQPIFAQQHLSSSVQVNTNSVYVGQPVEVTISVFTTTWFTKGVDPGNIKVNNAFTYYFRSVSSTERINGKTYAGINMIFNIFPYGEEDIIIPSLEINVESPDEGSSKGVSRVIKTEATRINVKPVPPNINRDEWMVGTDVSVSENWSGNLQQVKVGDVLERTILREVRWTVAELIPPVQWDSITGVSIYPSRAEVKNNRSKTEISASRKEGVKYLFEKEGEIVIPELVISWWNPKVNKMQKRTLKEQVINVQSNPDLGILESVRDSLDVATAENNELETGGKGFSLLGFSLKQLLIGLTVLLLFLYFIHNIYIALKKRLKEKRQNYIQSELFYFRRFEKALKLKDAHLSEKSFYRWLDQIKLKEPTLNFFIENFGTKQLQEEYKKLELLKGKPEHFIFNKKLWNESRMKFIKSGKNIEIGNESIWINP